ncbi:MAG: response regulator [Candidatus Bathyarchaeia archaeon]
MRKASILVVDDDEDIRKMMRLILEGEGYEVDEAVSAREAIEKSKMKVYDVALLDIVLPDMQGTFLLRELKETTPKMIKIMVTGYPNLENAVESLNLGADAYLMKPVNFEKLINVVEEKLAERKAEEILTVERIAAFVEARTKKLLQEMEEHSLK